MENKSIGELSVDRAVDRGCLIKNASPFVKSSADNTTSTLAVAEITQTAGGNGYYGSFVVPSNGISFLLSIFKDSNAIVEFYSLADPDGTDILSASSTPNLYNAASGSLGVDRYANVLVPQSPSFSAKAGTWTFKANNNDRVKIITRTGSTPSDNATITIQPYITGTTWSAGDISVALIIMKRIYSKNGITLTINDTITISDTQYTKVSKTFINSTTSALVSQGVTEGVNLFFIEDYSVSDNLGNAPGIPGSMGTANSWNGVLISLAAHADSVNILDSQLLGETAAHEMGHQLGLFHTTESGGTVFDILTDTAECLNSTKDFDRNGKMSAEECEGYGGENLMFWTAWTTSSRSAGKKQETLSSHQQHVLKYSPIAK
ncbi:MAG: hypothetical protein NZ852_06405 [SAR324 cluster bacterium]|nr:hypothetical protein [SAR324 cluster bacterium]